MPESVNLLLRGPLLSYKSFGKTLSFGRAREVPGQYEYATGQLGCRPDLNYNLAVYK